MSGSVIPVQFILQGQNASGVLQDYLRIYNSGLVTFGDLDTGIQTTGGNEIGFVMGGVTRIILDSAGRGLFGASSTIATAVGVHTSVQIDGGGSAGETIRRWSADNQSAVLAFGKSRSATIGSLGAAVASGDDLAAIHADGDDGTALRRAASIKATVGAAPSAGVVSAGWSFWTHNGTSLSARMNLTHAGDLGIGTTSPTTKLDVAGAIRISGAGQYTVATLPSASAFGAGAQIYVSNGTSNKRLAVSDGTSWRWPDGAVVS